MRASCWIAALWLLVPSISVLASSTGPAEPPSPYRIGPGDRLRIEVWREPDLSGVLRVDSEGRLHHVLAGTLEAAGRTCQEVARELAARLERDYLREAHVVVSVEESARRRAAVLGAVAHPGTYPLAPGARVLDLLLAAGGPSADAAGQATLIRVEPAGTEGAAAGKRRAPRRSKRVIDLEALLERGDPEQNPLLEPGDLLTVARAPSGVADASGVGRVRVVGEVVRPGSFRLSEAPTALDALLAAGGFTEWAAGNRARLVRERAGQRSTQRVRLGDLVQGKAGVANPKLRAGDLLVIPKALF